jgi:hypothetical protein
VHLGEEGEEAGEQVIFEWFEIPEGREEHGGVPPALADALKKEAKALGRGPPEQRAVVDDAMGEELEARCVEIGVIFDNQARALGEVLDRLGGKIAPGARQKAIHQDVEDGRTEQGPDGNESASAGDAEGMLVGELVDRTVLEDAGTHARWETFEARPPLNGVGHEVAEEDQWLRVRKQGVGEEVHGKREG